MTKSAAFLVLMLAHLPLWSSAADIVHWLTADAPPMYIYEGAWAGQGFGDQELRLLMSQIPNYDHRIVTADSARITYELGHSDSTWWPPSKMRNEKKWLFSPTAPPSFRAIVSSF
jgi:uncharacterized protein (TIGR02285 family)